MILYYNRFALPGVTPEDQETPHSMADDPVGPPPDTPPRPPSPPGESTPFDADDHDMAPPEHGD
eukprot:6669424-Prorocentrum_lima.AAC.1